jgi:Tol biopolymer transport system component
VRRSGCLGLPCACALAALASGCLFDDDSSSGRSSANRSTTSTSHSAGDLLQKLDGWRLAFVSKHPEDRYPRIYSAEADGTDLRPVDDLRGDKQTPNWSPDGRRIAFRWNLGAETNTPLAIIDADGSNFVNLSKATGLRGWAPSWSPDGNRLVAAAASKPGTPPSLYVMDADGSNVRRITGAGREAQYAQWSPDGDWVAFTFVVDGGFDIFKVRPDGSNLTALTDDGSSGTNNWPIWSPDSKQIGYGRGSGSGELWVMNADGSGKHLVTDVGGVPGAWAPGRYLTFGCPGEDDIITLCAVRTDGSGLTTLLGGMEANFPGWRPQR